ncbi:bifunctional methylenetetrahydrofolate dehydrogenase/methenyltetrahydrofolate cyclohydrolase [Candidatus Uhrbacteria bacterium]|nr:bifunctional methylenetetrahydrofolate dehydrogenase/methenyltetrahydrofolate cyclohydrolase [Candidatus Uhrbacteria bacterium]
MALILNGKNLAMAIREKIKTRVAALSTPPGLAVILVGSDPASHTYVALKKKACEQVGIRFEQHLYFATESEDTLIKKIQELNARPDVNGILVQLPLPTQNADRVIAAIDPLKDVDGFHPVNLENLEAGKPAIASAVALGILKLIGEAPHKTGSQAVIVSSPLFAQPLQILLREQNITATVVDPDAQDLAKTTRAADILIVAVGHPGLITGGMVKPGAVVIDVGTTRTDAGLKGDVDFPCVEPIAGAITPVPGGVGPMTVAMLLVNILKARDLQRS